MKAVSSHAAEFLGSGFADLGIDVRDGHVGARLGERDGAGAPDADGAAGDEGFPAGEIEER